MNSRIRLDIVLREAVATPYRDLVTRSTGAAVRHRVLTVLRDTPVECADLDFSQVGLVDFSCADEVVAKLLMETLGLPMQRLMLRGVQDHHADAIEQALSRYDMVIVAVLATSTEPQLLGPAPEDWRDAFRAVTRLGRAPVPPVADVLAWPLLRTADALRALAHRRCLVAHADDTFELGTVA